MDVLSTVISNQNTWYVMLIVGIIVWVVRQFTSKKLESAKWFKAILRIVPLLLGTGIALIPGLRPVEGNLMQSGAVGFIAGSFSTTAYELLREIVTKKIRDVLGSKAKRVSDEGDSVKTNGIS